MMKEGTKKKEEKYNKKRAAGTFVQSGQTNKQEKKDADRAFVQRLRGFFFCSSSNYVLYYWYLQCSYRYFVSPDKLIFLIDS